MIRPGERAIRALWALAAVALLLPLVPGLYWLPALGLLALAGTVGVESLVLRRQRLVAERPEQVALSLGEAEELTLTVAGGAQPLRLELRQVWPGLLQPNSSTRRGLLRPGELLQVDFEVRGVSRGSAALEPPWVALSRWGWAERLVALEAPGELHVLPNLRAVRRLHGELNRFALRGLGSRADVRLGKGREFDRLREYVAGDDFRDVAWKASASHRKLIVREYRVDRSQDVVVCVDRGHRMTARVGALTRLDHALDAAMLLAYISNRMEDRVGLLSFAAEVESGVPQGRGKAHLRTLTRYATGVEPAYLHSDYRALAAQLRRRQRQRALLILLTAPPELGEHGALVEAVSVLAPRHLPVVIFFTNPDLEATARALPADRAELCRSLVARDLWGARQRVTAELRRRGALVVETPPGDAGVEAVNAYVEVKRRQLL